MKQVQNIRIISVSWFIQIHGTCKYIDQSVYQKYGPNLQKIATEMKPFDLTSYIYWL